MWLVTTQGFYSAVAHWKKPDIILVRARVRADLNRLERQLPDANIKRRVYRDKRADYPYRIELTREEWATALMDLAVKIDYGNFKSAVGRRQGWNREKVYHRVWDVLVDLEPDHWGRRFGGRWKRGKKSKKKTTTTTTTSFFMPDPPNPLDFVECPAGCVEGADEATGLPCGTCFGFGDVLRGELDAFRRAEAEDRDDTINAGQLALEQ
ncbi:MAG TPA: hypothetical protein VF192_00910, partial [Longimicrobiales bacterium]